MLELIVVTVVMVTREPIVVVALVLMRDPCNVSGAVIGQRLNGVSKPGVVRNAAAK